MPVADTVAVICSGTFFGAAIYISLVQHPAAIEAGADVGGRFFPPMYRRASSMQVSLAVIGTLAGLIAWWSGDTIAWLVGAIFLASVVPVTILLIKPINDVLLDPARAPDAADTAKLLRQWGPRHWLRSVVSGLSFMLYLLAYAVD